MMIHQKGKKSLPTQPAYLCHHTGRPFWEQRVPDVRSLGAVSAQMEQELDDGRYQAIPLADSAFAYTEAEDGSNKPVVAVHSLESAKRFHGKGKRGFMSLIAPLPDGEK